jgi:hypothetical protein
MGACNLITDVVVLHVSFFRGLLISLLLVLQIATLAPLQKKFTHLKSQLLLKTYDLSLFEGQAEQSEHHKVRI